MNEHAHHTVEGLLGEFAARRLSPVEVLDACAARIDAVDGLVGAFTALCLERAREEAVASEAAWARGERSRARGGPVRGQGPVRLRGRAHGVRLADVRRARPDARRRGGRPGTRGRRDPRRQDADARVRLGHHLRQRAARLGAQPVGARSRLGRLERRLGRRARCGRGAARARQRHRRLDPRAGRVLRHRRAEADLREDQRGAGVAARPLARPSRPDGDDPRRRGAAARGDRRGRRRRSLDRGRAARRRAGRAPPRARRPRRRNLRRPASRPARRRRPRRSSMATLRTSQGPARGSSTSRCRRPELVLPAFRTIQSAEALETHRRAGIFPSRRDEYGERRRSAGSTPRPR